MQNWTDLYNSKLTTKDVLLHEPLITQDRHDAWDDLASNTCISAIFFPLEEDVVVIEELSDDKVSSSVNLFFKIANVIFTACCSQMNLWVAGDTNAEVISILLPDKLDKVNCIIEAVVNLHPVSFP